MEWIFSLFYWKPTHLLFISKQNRYRLLNKRKKGWPLECSSWSKNTTKKEDEEKKENWNQIGAINHSTLVTPYIQLGLSNSVYKDYFLIPPPRSACSPCQFYQLKWDKKNLQSQKLAIWFINTNIIILITILVFYWLPIFEITFFTSLFRSTCFIGA